MDPGMSWRSASLWLTAVCGLLAGLANGLMAMRVHVVAAAWVACGMTKREHMKASRRELAWRVSVRVPCEDAWLRSTLCACVAGTGQGLVSFESGIVPPLGISAGRVAVAHLPRPRRSRGFCNILVDAMD